MLEEDTITPVCRSSYMDIYTKKVEPVAAPAIEVVEA